MFSTIEDRLRIPWYNGKGAIKVNLDIAFPLVVVPSGILLGSLHSALTILVLVFMPLSLLTFYRLWLRQQRKTRTKLFYAWGVVSFVQMYLTFQIVIVSYREILLWENMLLHTLIFAMLFAFYNSKKDPGIIRRKPEQDDHCIGEKTFGRMQNGVNAYGQDKEIGNTLRKSKGGIGQEEGSTDESQIGPIGQILMQNFGLTEEIVQECIEDRKKEEKEMSYVIPAEEVLWVDSRMVKGGMVAMWCKTCRLVKPARAGHCPVCNVCICGRDHHCIWIDNCVGANNHRSFFAAVLLFLVTCCYGVHLSMTTLCTPVIFLDWLLIPGDCIFLYSDFPSALSFVSTVYSMCAMIGMSLVFITQCVLISQNVTSHEMHTATFRRWVSRGVYVRHNSLNRGCWKNWTSFLRGNRKSEQHYQIPTHRGCDCV